MRSTPIAEVGNFTAVLQQISERLDNLEKCVSDLKQYETDHNELHQIIAAAAGKNNNALQKTLAEAVTSHQQTMRLSIEHHSQQVAETLATNLETTRSMIAAIATAIEQSTDVKLPEQVLNVTVPERELLDYKLIRKGNLLDTIKEVKQT